MRRNWIGLGSLTSNPNRFNVNTCDRHRPCHRRCHHAWRACRHPWRACHRHRRSSKTNSSTFGCPGPIWACSSSCWSPMACCPSWPRAEESSEAAEERQIWKVCPLQAVAATAADGPARQSPAVPGCHSPAQAAWGSAARWSSAASAPASHPGAAGSHPCPCSPGGDRPNPPGSRIKQGVRVRVCFKGYFRGCHWYRGRTLFCGYSTVRNIGTRSPKEQCCW